VTRGAVTATRAGGTTARVTRGAVTATPAGGTTARVTRGAGRPLGDQRGAKPCTPRPPDI